MADKTKCELALADYRAGGDRYDLLFSLRDCDIPDDILDSFFKARDGSGRKILLPTLVGDDLDADRTASCHSQSEGETCAQMIVLDDSVLLYFSHDVHADGNDTLVLACARSHIEPSALEFYLKEKRGDENPHVRVPIVLPFKIGSIGGGSGFVWERTAAYMKKFEPNDEGLFTPAENWEEEVVAASNCILMKRTYDPEDETKVSIDPYGCATFNVNTNKVLPKLQEVLERPPRTDPPPCGCYCLASRMTEGEMEACNYYNTVLMSLYQMLGDDIEDLPKPGALALRKVRHPVILLRELVQRGRAKIRRLDPADDVSNNKRLKFIFSVCTSDVFECIVRQLPVQQLW